MKLKHLVAYLLTTALLGSCQTREASEEIVCETIHRYGVPLEPQDWKERGACGLITSMRKDGTQVMRHYDNGLLHGECSYTFPHRSTIQKKEWYEAGVLVQEQTYYPSGLPFQQTVKPRSGAEQRTTWYDNGAPQASEAIEDGCLIEGTYYSLDQQEEGRVQRGRGLRICRDGSGELQYVDTIENGKMVLRTTYHANGAPSSLTPYVNGQIEGERRTFLIGGEPAAVEQWVANKQNGLTVEYEEGEKRAEVPYVAGKKQGLERRFKSEGQFVVQEITWVQGLKHGPSYTYLPQSPGKPVSTTWYFRGQEVPNKATFDMLSNKSL